MLKDNMELILFKYCLIGGTIASFQIINCEGMWIFLGYGILLYSFIMSSLHFSNYLKEIRKQIKDDIKNDNKKKIKVYRHSDYYYHACSSNTFMEYYAKFLINKDYQEEKYYEIKEKVVTVNGKNYVYYKENMTQSVEIKIDGVYYYII